MKYDKNKLFKNHMNKKEKKTTFFLLKLSYKTEIIQAKFSSTSSQVINAGEITV